MYIDARKKLRLKFVIVECLQITLQFEVICEVKIAKMHRHGETLQICTPQFAIIEKYGLQSGNSGLVIRSPELANDRNYKFSCDFKSHTLSTSL